MLDPVDPPPRWREWAPLILRVAACAGLGQWFLGPLLHDAHGALAQPALLGAGWGVGLHAAERFALRSHLGPFGRIALGTAAGTLLGLLVLVLAHAPAGMDAWRSLDWFADPTAKGPGHAFDATERSIPRALGLTGAALVGFATWPRARTCLSLLALAIGLVFLWHTPREVYGTWSSAEGGRTLGDRITSRTWGITTLVAFLPLGWSLAGLIDPRPSSAPHPSSQRRRLLELPLAVLALWTLGSLATWLRDGADALTDWPLRELDARGVEVFEKRPSVPPARLWTGTGFTGAPVALEEPSWMLATLVRGLAHLDAGELSRAERDLRAVQASLPEDDDSRAELIRRLGLALALVDAHRDPGDTASIASQVAGLAAGGQPSLAEVETLAWRLGAALLRERRPDPAGHRALDDVARLRPDDSEARLAVERIRAVLASVELGPAHWRDLELRRSLPWTVELSVEHAFVAGTNGPDRHPVGQDAWSSFARHEIDVTTFLRREPGPFAALAAGIRLDIEGDAAGALVQYERASLGDHALAAAWALRRAEELRAR